MQYSLQQKNLAFREVRTYIQHVDRFTAVYKQMWRKMTSFFSFAFEQKERDGKQDNAPQPPKSLDEKEEERKRREEEERRRREEEERKKKKNNGDDTGGSNGQDK